MVEFITEQQRRASLKLRVNMVASSNCDQQFMFNRACAISSLIDSLKAHYDIDLAIVLPIAGTSGGQLKHDKLIVEYHIDTRNGYSFSQLLFTTHPAYLRRIYFRTVEVLSQRSNLYGYGHNMDTSSWREALGWDKADTIYFPSIDYEGNKYDFATVDKAVESVVKLAKAQSLELA